MQHIFLQKLRHIQSKKKTVLCVGLDPDPARLPRHLLQQTDVADAIVAFCAAVAEATYHAACAFKLNLAFFEVLGSRGWETLEKTLACIPGGTLIIGDAKRGDIGNSARFYAQALFEHLGCDACTVSPYMGRDAVEPFLQYADRGTFVLARTSNRGAADFQERDCEGMKLYLRVATQVAAWDAENPGTAGLVAGATDLDALAAIRRACPALPLLIPGVGTQGGDARAVMQAAATPEGPVLVNSSRQILYASGGTDFAEAAAREAEALRDTLAQAQTSAP